MKTKLLIFLPMIALFFSSCGDDDKDIESKEMTVLVSVYYEMTNSEHEYPDSNSDVYVFRGTEFTDSKFEYKGEGKFYNKDNGNWSEAKQTLSMGNSVVIPVKCSYDCTIVVESAYYKGSYEVKTKSLKDKDKTIKVVFPAKEK